MRLLPSDFGAHLLPISLGQLIGMLCGVAGVTLMSHLVAADDYGRYALFLTAAPLGMWVSHAGLIKFAGRRWGESPARASLLRELLAGFVRKLPWLLGGAALVAYLIDPARWAATFVALAVVASLLAAIAAVGAALQSARENWLDLAVGSTASLTRTFLPPLFYTIAGGSVLALYSGLGLHALVTAALAALALRRYWSCPNPAPMQMRAIYEGPLFTILAIVGWIMAGLNRWIVAALFGTAETGYFSLASNIGMMSATLLATVCTQYFQPGLFTAPQDTPAAVRQLARRVDRIAIGYCTIALTGVLALRLVTPWLVGNLISSDYAPTIGYIVPAGFFLTAMLTSTFYHMLLLAAKKESACGPVDLSPAFVVAIGCISSAWFGGVGWFRVWLCLTPLAPWLLTRPLARHYLGLRTSPRDAEVSPAR